jgi:hypothetical protein
MTTCFTVTKSCGNCGAEGRYKQLGSTNAIGSPDLDQRPPGMMRATLDLQVQRCEACGYCGGDVSSGRPGAGAVVASAGYRSLLGDGSHPELANSFRCAALIDCACGDLVGAARALIRAAWACDDEGAEGQAAACRREAASAILEAEGQGQPLYEEPAGATTAVLVDLLRRAGEFAQASALLAARRGAAVDDVVGRVLAFEQELVDRGDAGRHTMREVQGGTAQQPGNRGGRIPGMQG